jgi:phage tail protein X
MQRVVYARQGDTVDLICHRTYGQTGMTQAVLEANPGLAAHGPILPQGARLVMPPAPTPTPDTPVHLWD